MNNHSDDLTSRLRQSLSARGPAPDLTDDVVTGAATRTAPRIIDRKRIAQGAGAATLALAALTVGTLVVAPTFQRAPLFTAASDGAANSFGASEDSSSSDLRIGVWMDYRYEAGEGLSDESGSGHVYQLDRVGSPEQVLRDVADALGVEGEVAESEYSDPAYPTYVIGPEDGTAPSVVVSWTGTGNWWYNNPDAYPAPVCEMVPYEGDPATDVPAGEEVPAEVEVCDAGEPGENLAPSESEARAEALDLFRASGLDVSADDIRVTADEWQTMASANLTVGGVATAVDWAIGWSTTGDIAWAYGHSIEVVDRGSYDTVSATDAVERLADWRWFGSAGPAYQGGVVPFAADSSDTSELGAEDPDKTAETPAEGEGSEPADPGIEPEPLPTEDAGETPTEEPSIEPMPEPTPEVVYVTVDEAEQTLLLMWDSEGNAWLVPGFAMQTPEGWWNTVVSLIEGVIELPEPIAIEPYLEDDSTVLR